MPHRQIELPYAPGCSFNSWNLYDHIQNQYQGSLLVGKDRATFENHRYPQGFDYWLRQHYSGNRRDVMQASNEVIMALIDTGCFSTRPQENNLPGRNPTYLFINEE